MPVLNVRYEVAMVIGMYASVFDSYLNEQMYK